MSEDSLKRKFVFFATNNVNKFNEAREILAQNKISVGMIRIKSLEIQSNSLTEIAKASVLDSFRTYKLPIVVEDDGLFVDALNGFPGPYAAHAFRTIGNQGLLRLMRDMVDRKACFESVVSYQSLQLSVPVCFEGVSTGEILHEEVKPLGKTSFGFDPIFRPDRSRKAFAQMSISEKCSFSHRANAFRKFGRWYIEFKTT